MASIKKKYYWMHQGRLFGKLIEIISKLAVVMPTVESITVVDSRKKYEIVLRKYLKCGGVPLAIKELVPRKLLSTVMGYLERKRLDL